MADTPTRDTSLARPASPATHRDSASATMIDSNTIGDKQKGNGASDTVHPSNSFDVYGDETKADSECSLVSRSYEYVDSTHAHIVKYRTMVWWKASALM